MLLVHLFCYVDWSFIVKNYYLKLFGINFESTTQLHNIHCLKVKKWSECLLRNARCSRNTFHILSCHLCGASELGQVIMVAPYRLMSYYFSNVINYNYTLDQCTFDDKTFFKTGESVIATQRDFHAHFMLFQNDAVLNRKSILLWVEK